VKIALAGGQVKVEGPKGKLALAVHPHITVAWDDKTRVLTVQRASDIKQDRALHGLTRALLANAVFGVVTGYKQALEIQGVGYSARVQGNKLLLTVGFANVVEMVIPPQIKVETPVATQVVITGPDKQMVGHFAAVARKVRPPEPYKGKGIRYLGEVVRRKAGKQFAGGATS
jgi:large subunit ribosomal protein L6